MRLPRLLAVPVLASLLLAVPGPPPASAAPAPVAARVVELPLPTTVSYRPLDQSAAAGRTVVLTGLLETKPFEVVGLTWDADGVGSLAVSVRTRSEGAWSAWTPLGVEDEDPHDPADPDAAGIRLGTDPLWVGPADGVQARVDVLSGAAPRGVKLALVDPGDAPADTAAGAHPLSLAESSAPPVQPRSAWGADESIRGRDAGYSWSLKAATLHHTASSNAYDREDVPGLLRGFYAYHVKSRGWSDLGYNFLVDRFGTVWEGRAGGITRNVIGAHAGGFNTSTVGISMIGTYDTAEPSSAMLESVARLTAWKLGGAGVDPQGSVALTSAGSTRHPAGTPVTLPTVFGHLDVSTTSCPGTKGYAALGGIRSRAAALVAEGAHVTIPPDPEPEARPAPRPGPSTPLSVQAPASVPVGSGVSVVVRGPADAPVQLWFAREGAGATLRRRAVLSAEGVYTTSFSAEATYSLLAVSGERSSPRITVAAAGARQTPAEPGPLGIRGPVTVAAHTPALVTVTGPAGTAVSVWFRKQGASTFARLREGVLGPDGTWTTTYVSDLPHEYFAMSTTLTSPDAATAVGPVPNGLHVTTPTRVEEGASVPLVVSGPPGAAVDVWFSRAGEPFARRRQAVLAADGTYRTSWPATASHSVFAATAERTSTRVRTTVDGATGTTAGPVHPSLWVATPDDVEAGRTAEVTVSGRPGAPVDVWFRERHERVFTKRRGGTLDAQGLFRASYTASDDQEVFATSGDAASRDAAVAVQPVVWAPGTARLGRVRVTGRARPGDVVVVTGSRRSGGRTTVRATASPTGTFSVSSPLGDETAWRASIAGRTSAPVTTTITPTVTGPAVAPWGGASRFSGTGRPGALAELLVRKKGASGYVVARRLVVTPRGRFATTASLSVDHRWYVRSDGRASALGITRVR